MVGVKDVLLKAVEEGWVCGLQVGLVYQHAAAEGRVHDAALVAECAQSDARNALAPDVAPDLGGAGKCGE